MNFRERRIVLERLSIKKNFQKLPALTSPILSSARSTDIQESPKHKTHNN